MFKRVSLLLIVVGLTGNSAWGKGDFDHSRDSIRGVPLADFSLGKVKIPCVWVKNLNPNVDGKFFDVILDRRGNSMNFELSFAEPENPALCQSIDNFAQFEESFEGHGEDHPLGDSRIELICKQKGARSKVKLEARTLPPGRYLAVIASGSNTASGAPIIHEDEVEFEFDSDPKEIAEGATPIAPDFIQAGAVSAQILDEFGRTIAAVGPVTCLNR